MRPLPSITASLKTDKDQEEQQLRMAASKAKMDMDGIIADGYRRDRAI
jgi:hypothetical protein